MRKITLKAYAKINLCFDILGKDEESGFHTVDTIMQSIELADYVNVTRRSDFECTSQVAGGSITDTSALAAARLFCERFGTKGVDIKILKMIPVSGGLGGSSADAAATLRAMALIFEKDFCEVEPLAEELGSDVKFMFHGGLARCTGRGEIIELLEPLPPLCVLLVNPVGGVSTKDAYEAYDKITKKPFTVRTEDILANAREYKSNRLLSINCLYAPACSLNKEVAKALKFLNDDRAPFHVAMSGSGSTCYALYEDAEKAYAMADAAPEGLAAKVYGTVDRY